MTLRQISSFLKNADIQKFWIHWVMIGVQNPSSQDTTKSFRVVFRGKQDNEILWNYQSPIKIRISDPPEYVKLYKIDVTDNNIKQQADHTFYLQRANNKTFGSLYDNKFAIVIKMPKTVYENSHKIQQGNLTCAVSYTDKEPETVAECQMYRNELFIDNIYMRQRNFSDILKIKIKNLANPTEANVCEDKASARYHVKVFGTASQYAMSTSPQIDAINCLQFIQQYYDIKCLGQKNLMPGVTYNFTLKLDQEASNLTIYPTIHYRYIVINPTAVRFDQYQGLTQPFQVIVKSDAKPGKYSISFRLVQDAELPQQYSNMLPFDFSVLEDNSINKAINPPPVVEIKDKVFDSIGYPMEVQMLVSKPPATLFYINIEVVNNVNNALQINPQRVIINTNTYETSFTVTLKTDIVPDKMQLKFSTYGPTKVQHVLKPQVMHIYFSLGSTLVSNPPILKVHISANPGPSISSQLAGKPVLSEGTLASSNQTSSTSIKQKIMPELIEAKQIGKSSNAVTLRVTLSAQGTIIYAICLHGTPAPTVEELMYSNFKKALQFGKERIEDENGQQEKKYQKEISVTRLEPQTNYMIYLTIKSALGYSEVKHRQFSTGEVNEGYKISFYISQITNNSSSMITKILHALSIALKLPQSRFYMITDAANLDAQAQHYSTATSSFQSLNVQVLISPDLVNDYPPPKYYAEQLMSNQDTRAKLKQYLPEFTVSEKQ